MGQVTVKLSLDEELDPMIERIITLEKRMAALEEAIPSETLAYRVKKIAEMVGVTAHEIYNRINRGELLAHKLGAATLVYRRDLIDWLEGLPYAQKWAVKERRG
jgi:excisionase family DNA binding protein